MAMPKYCTYPAGVEIRPDGVNPMFPHIYEVAEIHTHCDFHVLKSTDSDHTEYEWYRTGDSEDIIYAELPPDEGDYIVPHVFMLDEIIHNCTVEVAVCKLCGHVTLTALADEDSWHESVKGERLK